MPSENTRRIAKNTAMLYIRMLLIMVVSLYTSRVVLNTLGVEDYGIYNVVGGVVVMFSFLNGAMASATQRFLAFEIGKNDFVQLRKTFSLTVTIHIAIAFFILILAETIGLWFLNTQLNIPLGRMNAARWIYQFSVLSFVISVIQVPYNAAIIARERMNVYAYLSILEVFLKLLIVFILTWIAWDKLKLYAVLIFGTTVTMAFLYQIYCRRKFKECRWYFVWDKRLYRTLLGYAGWNMSGHIAVIARTQGINILLNIFFGPVLNAARGIAVQVSTAILSFVTNFQLAVNPQIVKSYACGELEDMKRLIIQSSKFSFLLLFFLAAPFLLETEFILRIWLKIIPDYGILFCRLIIMTTLVDVLSGTLGYGALATGKVKKYWLILSSVLLLNLPLSYLFFKMGYPPQLTLYIEMGLYFVALFVRLILLKELLAFPINYYLREVVGRSLVVVLVSITAPLLLAMILPPGWQRFLIVSGLSLLSTAGIGYSLGLNRYERLWIKDKLRNKLKRIVINRNHEK